MPRVLLFHATVGTGHKTAANALRKAFEMRQPGDVGVVDTLDLTPSFFRKTYSRAYIDVTNNAPLAWGLFYKQTDRAPELAELTNNLRKLMESVSLVDLEDLLETFKPEIIICTHFLPINLLLRKKRKGEIQIPLYCVVTDHAVHTFWLYPDIDGYFVASEMVREQLIERGISGNIIHVTGIPVDPQIATPKDKDAVRVQHDLPREGFVITLFAGGIQNERVRGIVTSILKSHHRGTLVLVAGRNETLGDEVNNLQRGSTMDIRMYGYINFVDDLVAASDVVITKAGGLIVSEILARGTPMIVIDPILGHEEWNADYVVCHGAGVQVRMSESVPILVDNLLRHPIWLDELRKGAVAAGKPRAAQDIAGIVIQQFSGQR